MAGHGRGRRTLGLDPVGTSRGDSLPPAQCSPTPVFPAMEQKPLPLAGGEESEYLMALKQDFRAAMRSQPCFIQPAAAHRDVERYSDKYHLSDKMDALTDWIIDWKRFPKELRVPIRKSRDGAALSRLAAAPSEQKKKVGEKEEVLLKLETLEKKEQQESSEEEGEEQKEEEAEEEYDEEEFEEETDYIMSYFDNGEDFGGDSDDNMDEAVY
ncbi:LOW QUALITY PROTEIN: DNA-directed RNA polymerase III subunit RPC7-like [Poeciliopsis prolifica]|uniref:LOW QUALITY PROTEIN: DNA-directed RNA polymerase III subunit RPC7-like n=1 Tax=Poeciliopsis prolifica TaxID=188132 RepID=UPI0024145D31|nr:LOW QUALITY PROTEIN: DNA-directed RNA polymerase III subunit RPC7-like [Poeciliopsis prolifica]